ncbi:MAG: hypothetical protein VX335_04595 [Pseudomonadota bacterium]|nr:hypothetical protein [Pseudomonadota bacterium]
MGKANITESYGHGKTPEVNVDYEIYKLFFLAAITQNMRNNKLKKDSIYLYRESFLELCEARIDNIKLLSGNNDAIIEQLEKLRNEITAMDDITAAAHIMKTAKVIPNDNIKNSIAKGLTLSNETVDTGVTRVEDYLKNINEWDSCLDKAKNKGFNLFLLLSSIAVTIGLIVTYTSLVAALTGLIGAALSPPVLPILIAASIAVSIYSGIQLYTTETISNDKQLLSELELAAERDSSHSINGHEDRVSQKERPQEAKSLLHGNVECKTKPENDKSTDSDEEHETDKKNINFEK